MIFLAPALLIALVFRLRAGMPLRAAVVWAILGVYGLWAADLLFFPLIVDANARAADSYLADMLGHWVNLVPFSTIGRQVSHFSSTTARQLYGNIGLLLPLGLFGPVVLSSLRSLGRLVLVAAAVSVAIELVQLLGTLTRVLDRSVDVDDVILNVAGAVVGWVLWRAARAIRGSVPLRKGN